MNLLTDIHQDDSIQLDLDNFSKKPTKSKVKQTKKEGKFQSRHMLNFGSFKISLMKSKHLNDLIKNITVETDYLPGEKMEFDKDVYNLTIAANITKDCTP